MKNRPKIKLKLTTFDKLIEGVSLLSILLLFAFIFYSYKDLPGIIPVHYNFSGEVDRLAGKGNIFPYPL